MVIITKKTDADGNEVTNKEVLAGEAAEAFELEEMKEDGLGDIDVNIEKTSVGNGNRIIKIRKEKHGEETEEIEMELDDADLKILEKDGNIFITEDFSDDENMEIGKNSRGKRRSYYRNHHQT